MLVHNKWGVFLRISTREGWGNESLVGCFMRDVLAVCGVIVLAVCLGVSAAYMSVDLTPPGLDLIRPPKPDVVAQIKVQERQDTIRAQASGCKYCVTVADLAQRFARHARSAREQANALRRTISVEKKEVVRQDQLRLAERTADSAEAAAAALTGWASRCRSEDFCRLPPKRAASSSCDGDMAASVGAAYELAAVVKRAANDCAAASCPEVDCQASAMLRSDILGVERTLSAFGGALAPHSRPGSVAELPVGPSTLSAEIRRVSDEATYLSKMIPVLLEATASRSAEGRLPRVTAGLVDDRAIFVAQLATVMEHSADLAGSARNDLRSEAAWRLKALATSLTQLGRETETRDVTTINWRLAADYLGAALLDVARLQAILGRAGSASAGATACKAVAPEATQQLRQAVAMLDLCRMRSACANRAGSAGGARPTNVAALIQRAQETAAVLSVENVSATGAVAVSTTTPQRPIDLVRAQYAVCAKPGVLREASVNTPAPAVVPAVAPVSPQDLVSGVGSAAIEAPAEANVRGPSLIEASAPALEAGGVDDAVPADAPAADAVPQFSGGILTPGGDPAFANSQDSLTSGN